MGKVGRPSKAPEDKSVRFNVTVSPDVARYVETLDNKSKFFDKAARILMRAYQKEGVATPAGKHPKGQGAR